MSSVSRSLQILELLVDSAQPPTHADLARALRIPKSTLSQILASLQKAGFVGNDGRHYFPDIRLLSLGQRIAHANNVRTAIKPYMDRLAVQTGETVLLGTMVGNHLIFLEQSPSPHPIRYVTEIGQPRPLHCTASGRVLLAFAHRSAHSLAPLASFTPNTITDPDLIDQMLEKVRRERCAVNDGESVEGVTAIAAPLLNDQGEAIATLSVTGPSSRLGEMRERLWPLLERTVREINDSHHAA